MLININSAMIVALASSNCPADFFKGGAIQDGKGCMNDCCNTCMGKAIEENAVSNYPANKE